MFTSTGKLAVHYDKHHPGCETQLQKQSMKPVFITPEKVAAKQLKQQLSQEQLSWTLPTPEFACNGNKISTTHGSSATPERSLPVANGNGQLSRKRIQAGGRTTDDETSCLQKQRKAETTSYLDVCPNHHSTGDINNEDGKLYKRYQP